MKKFLLQEIQCSNDGYAPAIKNSAMYDSFDESMAEAEKECLAECAFHSKYSNGRASYRKATEYDPIQAVFSLYNSAIGELDAWFITELNI